LPMTVGEHTILFIAGDEYRLAFLPKFWKEFAACKRRAFSPRVWGKRLSCFFKLEAGGVFHLCLVWKLYARISVLEICMVKGR
jgi:hypothetical protein